MLQIRVRPVDRRAGGERVVGHEIAAVGRRRRVVVVADDAVVGECERPHRDDDVANHVARGGGECIARVRRIEIRRRVVLQIPAVARRLRVLRGLHQRADLAAVRGADQEEIVVLDPGARPRRDDRRRVRHVLHDDRRRDAVRGLAAREANLVGRPGRAFRNRQRHQRGTVHHRRAVVIDVDAEAAQQARRRRQAEPGHARLALHLEQGDGAVDRAVAAAAGDALLVLVERERLHDDDADDHRQNEAHHQLDHREAARAPHGQFPTSVATLTNCRSALGAGRPPGNRDGDDRAVDGDAGLAARQVRKGRIACVRGEVRPVDPHLAEDFVGREHRVGAQLDSSPP